MKKRFTNISQFFYIEHTLLPYVGTYPCPCFIVPFGIKCFIVTESKLDPVAFSSLLALFYFSSTPFHPQSCVLPIKTNMFHCQSYFAFHITNFTFYIVIHFWSMLVLQLWGCVLPNDINIQPGCFNASIFRSLYNLFHLLYCLSLINACAPATGLCPAYRHLYVYTAPPPIAPI